MTGKIKLPSFFRDSFVFIFNYVFVCGIYEGGDGAPGVGVPHGFEQHDVDAGN